MADMDPSVSPGDDFYQYANGGWLKNNTIPADKSGYGAFDILAEETESQVRSLIEAAVGTSDSVSRLKRIVGDFYESGMDTVTLESAKFSPLDPDFMQIGMVKTPADIIAEVARELPLGSYVPFVAYVGQDAKKTDQYILSIYANGYGMPDRDYYFDESEHGKSLQESYRAMIAGLFKLMGREEGVATSISNDIYALEKDLAQNSYTKIQRRDPNLQYNKMTFEQLVALGKNLEWGLYFQNLGIDIPDTVLVDNPGYFRALNTLLVSVPVNVWQDYLTYHFVRSYASVLHQEVSDVIFDFYGRKLSGQQEQKPRWKRVISVCDGCIGDAIGQLYVEEYFPASSKERMLTMVENIRSSYGERIRGLEWMSEPTKEKALEKLAAMNVKIGYPDKWKDYSDLSVSKGKFALNYRNAAIFAFNENMARLGKPVDRDEWFMNPHTINAYYSPLMNEIVFPAGILQPPFFYKDADDAINYGGIGVVISHEITHGFDDMGRQFDKDGNLNDWWTPEDAARFEEGCKLLVDHFSSFEPVPGHPINGELTLGENLADFGGLTIALHALELAGSADEQSVGKIDGFTPVQRFFLSYARIWRSLTREEELIRRIATDVHSPAEYRVNCGVYNIDAFYEAFEVSESSPFYRSPDQRPKIW